LLGQPLVFAHCHWPVVVLQVQPIVPYRQRIPVSELVPETQLPVGWVAGQFPQSQSLLLP
jgi:hypothetical protein